MSQASPNVLAVVGDTDWWDAHVRKSLFIGLDSRLRTVRRDYSPNVWHTAFGVNTRTASSARLYAELGVITSNADTAGNLGGIFLSGTGSIVTFPGEIANSYGYQGSGTIRVNGAIADTGCATIAVGDRLGIMLYKDGSNHKLRFLHNGRYNLLGYSEQFTNAAWSPSAAGMIVNDDTLTFPVNTNYVQHNFTSRGGSVGAQFTFSCYVTSTETTSFNVSFADSSDGVPSYSQTVACTANVRRRVDFPATMGAGYSGTICIQILGGGIVSTTAQFRFEQLQVNAGLVADPYQKRTDAGGGYAGNPIATAAGAYNLAQSTYYTGTEYRMDVDADDLRYMPSDCQAWGAAARVADCGGYSPAATKMPTSIGATAAGFDAYGRVMNSSATSDIGAWLDAPNRSAATGFVYYEVKVEDGGIYGGMVGIGTRTHNVGGYSFPGHSAESWGYYGADGSKYHAGASAAYGNTFTTGDVIGMIWQPSTGMLWWSKNGVVQNSGNPQSGINAAYSNVTGDLVPMLSVYGGRHRIATHAREQLYRPTYCEAWDGADVLPEAFFRGTLKTPINFEQGIWFSAVWGNSSKSKSPLGAVELANSDGFYDAMIEASLRDQSISVYEFDSYLRATKEALVSIETIQAQAESSIRVISSERKTVLSTRLDYPLLVIGGTAQYCPVLPRDNGTGLEYDVCHTEFADFTVYDGGVEVIDWERLAAVSGKGCGFRRTVNPAKKQTTFVTTSVRYDAPALTNPTLTWSGGAITGWTIQTAGGGTVTDSGGNVRLLATTVQTARIRQFIGGGDGYDRYLRVNVTTRTGGDLAVYLESATLGVLDSRRIHIGGTGDFYVFVPGGQASDEDLVIENSTHANCDITITEVEITRCTPTRHIAYQLFGDFAGLTATTQYDTTLPSTAEMPTAYFTDKRPTIAELADLVLSQSLVAWFYNKNDVIEYTWLMAPEDVSDSVGNYRGEIAEHMVVGPISVEDELAPSLSDRGQMMRCYDVHSDTDIVTSITAGERNYLMKEALDHKLDLSLSNDSSDPRAYHPFYSAALAAPAMPRYSSNYFTDDPNIMTYGSGDPALKTCHRVYAKKRNRFKVTMKRDEFKAMQIVRGCLVNLKHTRYGLSAGKRLQVMNILDQLGGNVVTLTLRG